MSERTATNYLLKAKLCIYAIEHLIGPLLVFCIAFAHHLYFQDDFVSSFFAGFALLSVVAVLAFEKVGLLSACLLQLAFLGWVAIAGPQELKSQTVFSFSLIISLVATYLSADPKAVSKIAHTHAPHAQSQPTATPQKDNKLWQELFDARQEIKSLYQQKQEIEASLAAKLQEAAHEKEEKILYLEHHLEALKLEKEQMVEERQATEEDIKKLIANMHDMAVQQQQQTQMSLQGSLQEVSLQVSLQEVSVQEVSVQEVSLQEVSVQEAPLPVGETGPYEAMYRQLKTQFEEKSSVLDNTRKELFKKKEELEKLRRIVSEPTGPTEEERHLMASLEASEKKFEEQRRAHEEELIGYEEVIQGLLQQLHSKSQ